MTRPALARRRTHLRRLLKAARRDAGLTQTDLARRLGRTQSFVSKVEHGELQLEVVEFLDLARAVGLDPARLLTELERTR